MRMLLTALAFAVAATAATLAQASGSASETSSVKAPRDSIKLIVTGCLDDRVLRASDVEVPDDQEAPVIDRELFRLSAKKNVMAEVKRLQGRQLAVTGFVRKLDLKEPGFKVGRGRVIIGAPSSDPRRPQLPDTTERPIVLEVLSVAEAPGTCE
jgi:hypothetical protein